MKLNVWDCVSVIENNTANDIVFFFDLTWHTCIWFLLNILLLCSFTLSVVFYMSIETFVFCIDRGFFSMQFAIETWSRRKIWKIYRFVNLIQIRYTDHFLNCLHFQGKQSDPIATWGNVNHLITCNCQLYTEKANLC